jgi:acetyl esterase/lipase
MPIPRAAAPPSRPSAYAPHSVTAIGCPVLIGLALTALTGLCPAPLLGMEQLPPSVTADVVYGHKDGLAMTYDVLQPTGDANGRGLLFMVSGGWVSQWMPAETMLPLCQPFLEQGYTVFAVRHGSSPRYLVPEAVSDVQTALRHISHNAERWQVDPERLGVFGFSAGGHLSLMLATTGSGGNPSSAPAVRPAAVAAVVPPTDLHPYTNPGNPMLEQFPALKFDRQKVTSVSPLLQISEQTAPSLLVHGEVDELVPASHSHRYAERMTELGRPVQLIIIEGQGHGFDESGNNRTFQAMVDWFQNHLLTAP